MQRWLEHVTPQRASLEQLWCLKPFTALAVDRGCWTFRRESVIRAFSLGLLIAFIPPVPPLPIHLTLCALLGILFRLNLPVLIATTFISNPLTWCLQIVGSVWVGAKLMGIDLVPFVHELGRPSLWPHLSRLWPPLLLGALVLGLLAGGLGYVLAQLIWRARASSGAPATDPLNGGRRRARAERRRLA